MKLHTKKSILLIGDIITFYSALYLALVLRYNTFPSLDIVKNNFGPFTLPLIFCLIIFYIAELYDLNLIANNSRFTQKTLKSISVTGIAALTLFYIHPTDGFSPKTILLLFLLVFAFLFIQWRKFFNYALRSYLPKNNIAFIGFNDQVEELKNYLKKNQHLGFNTKLVVCDDHSKVNDTYWTDDLDNLSHILKDRDINSVILADDPNHSDDLRAALFSCLDLKIKIIKLPNFYESVTAKIPTDAITQMWFLENLDESDKKLYNIIKRTYDFFLAFFILIITIPFWIPIAITIKLESKGPVFIKMLRYGQGAKPFAMYKFRTMREENNDKSPTKQNDPRITKLGNILRKSRIDEIPQVINIIKNEMSFIGPRPELPHIADKLAEVIPFYRERMLIKPGITGWDQVSGEYHSPSVEDTIKKLQYDLFYIKNKSLWLDASTILKTISTILSRQGY